MGSSDDFAGTWAFFRARQMLKAMGQLGVADDTAQRIIALEHDWRDEIRCQSSHALGGPCATEATWMAFHACHVPPRPICENAAEEDERMREEGWRCLSCNQPAADCWRVVPWG